VCVLDKKEKEQKKMTISTHSCKRRLSALLVLKKEIFDLKNQHQEIQQTIAILNQFKITLMDQFPSAEFISYKCACSICQETIEQRSWILSEIENSITAQQRKKQKELVAEKTLAQSNTTSDIRNRKGGDQQQHQNETTAKPQKPKKDPEAAKAEILAEVRDLIQGMKSDAMNVSAAVHKSEAAYEQRQSDLAAKVEDTNKAAKNATGAENEMNGTSGAGGKMAESVLVLLGKVLPKTVVNTFLRPLIESIFQMLWIVVVVLVTISTIYLMITAPKAK
jgi:hypothetical protein